MLAHNDLNELICLISSWDRPVLINQFMTYRSSFPVDFSLDFLSGLSLDRLRHVLFALCVQNQRMPELDLIAA